jgi:crotonobetainyl-CoA:carnitine CoA-transferase CaiB-like acyl-CoA transferase
VNAPAQHDRPLAGVRIIDVTTVLMGPFATQMLGDMGADVIKIEPFQGDSHRTVGRAHSADLGLNFLNTGRNKRSLALDLKHAEARNIVDSLVKGADIFISNMRPAALKRLGLDYPSLQSINDGLIHVSLVGFGRDGRYAGLPAYDDLIQAAVGIPWLIQQGSGSEPGYVPLALCDRVVGVAALNPILAALFARSRDASGREIEVPMFETMVRLVLGDHLGQQVYEPASGPAGYGRLLSRHRRPYRTRDGYIGVLPFDDRHWRKLFRIAGRDELLPKEPITDRTADFDQLYGLLSDIIAEKTSGEWLALLRESDIPSMPMNSLLDLINDPHLGDVGFFQTRDHPSEGPVRMMVVPNGVTPGADVQISPAPHLGQQSTQILREAGFSDDQIDRFITEKVVRQSSEGDTAAAG